MITGVSFALPWAAGRAPHSFLKGSEVWARVFFCRCFRRVLQWAHKFSELGAHILSKDEEQSDRFQGPVRGALESAACFAECLSPSSKPREARKAPETLKSCLTEFILYCHNS